MTTYNDCIHVSTAMNESNDCSVKALAITTSISYDKAHRIMAIMGRKPGRSLSSRGWELQLRKLITAVKLADRLVSKPMTPQGLTIRTVGVRYPHGSFIIVTATHVAALVNGVVEDWTANRKHRVQYVIRVGV